MGLTLTLATLSRIDIEIIGVIFSLFLLLFATSNLGGEKFLSPQYPDPRAEVVLQPHLKNGGTRRQEMLQIVCSLPIIELYFLYSLFL